MSDELDGLDALLTVHRAALRKAAATLANSTALRPFGVDRQP